MKWLQRLLGLQVEAIAYPDDGPIEAGQRWAFTPSDESPWPPKTPTTQPVTILDAKAGWVRYDMGGIFRDERRTEESFRRMYRRVA